MKTNLFVPVAMVACLLFGPWACSDNDSDVTADAGTSDMAVQTDKGVGADQGTTPDGPSGGKDQAAGTDKTVAKFTLTSSDFQHNKDIDKKFSCQGSDISPALSWKNPPAGTKSFALIMDDPDAPGATFTHWLIYDIPASATSLKQNVAKTGTVTGVGVQGTNSFGKLGYGGPCPPAGAAHRYTFMLYALSDTLSAAPGLSKSGLLLKLTTKRLGVAMMTGMYKRQ